MTRDEIVKRLTEIRSQAARGMALLENKPLTPEAQAQIQSLAASLKNDLESEYRRMAPEKVQRSMTLFELSVYSPTIDEAWTDTGISRLKLDTMPNARWYEVLQAVCYKAGKYLD